MRSEVWSWADVYDAPKEFVGADQIIRQVCNKHRVSLDDMKTPCRKAEFVAARREAASRLRAEAGLSIPQIGLLLGGRDHSTVINLLRSKGMQTPTRKPPRVERKPQDRRIYVDRVRRLAQDGLTAAQAGERLDMTRSAVLGLAHRNGIKFQGRAQA